MNSRRVGRPDLCHLYLVVFFLGVGLGILWENNLIDQDNWWDEDEKDNREERYGYVKELEEDLDLRVGKLTLDED